MLSVHFVIYLQLNAKHWGDIYFFAKVVKWIHKTKQNKAKKINHEMMRGLQGYPDISFTHHYLQHIKWKYRLNSPVYIYNFINVPMDIFLRFYFLWLLAPKKYKKLLQCAHESFQQDSLCLQWHRAMLDKDYYINTSI